MLEEKIDGGGRLDTQLITFIRQKAERRVRVLGIRITRSSCFSLFGRKQEVNRKRATVASLALTNPQTATAYGEKRQCFNVTLLRTFYVFPVSLPDSPFSLQVFLVPNEYPISNIQYPISNIQNTKTGRLS